MPDDAVIIEIAAQTGYEEITRRAVEAGCAPGPFRWEDEPPALREDWRAAMRAALTAIEKITP
jgi:hypothetical protein